MAAVNWALAAAGPLGGDPGEIKKATPAWVQPWRYAKKREIMQEKSCEKKLHFSLKNAEKYRLSFLKILLTWVEVNEPPSGQNMGFSAKPNSI